MSKFQAGDTIRNVRDDDASIPIGFEATVEGYVGAVGVAFRDKDGVERVRFADEYELVAPPATGEKAAAAYAPPATAAGLDWLTSSIELMTANADDYLTEFDRGWLGALNAALFKLYHIHAVTRTVVEFEPVSAPAQR